MAKKEYKEPLMLDATGIKILNALQSIVITNKPVNNVTTPDATKPLSANMGKYLNDQKLDKSDVYNDLDETVAGKALDAVQGKVLNDKVVGVRGSNLAYRDSATYAVGDYAIYNEILYRCKTAIVTPESFDSTKWDAVDLKTNRDAINAIIKKYNYSPTTSSSGIASLGANKSKTILSVRCSNPINTLCIPFQTDSNNWECKFLDVVTMNPVSITQVNLAIYYTEHSDDN